jgi:transposase
MRRSKRSRPGKSGIVNQRAAGIDIGSREHYVCAGEGFPVRRFSCFTEELNALSAWLKECQVTTVAMEATGVYWIPLHQILERDGFEVVLVNSKHYRVVPGRKSDVQDCEWLQYMHQRGMVSGSFRPADEIVVLRTFTRQRESLVEEAARQIQRMQKALEQMNVQLHKVVTNMMGETGMAILRAIIDGERDPQKLAMLRNYRVKRSHADYVAALTGDWREEHLFCLTQAWTLYHQLQDHIAACDREIERRCTAFREADQLPDIPDAKSPPRHRAAPHAVSRDGMSPKAVLGILSEVGLDMTKWPTPDHFVSWLRLAPNRRVTGGRPLSSKTLPGRSRAAGIFRKCAENVARSHCYFGSFYRRMRARKGGAYAVVATAAKIARVFYRTLLTRTPYRDIGQHHFDTAHRQRALRSAVTRLRALGYEIDPAQLRPVSEAVR